MSRKELVAGIVMMLACWAVALMSSLGSSDAAGKLCAQDQVALKPYYQVDMAFADGSRRSFCNNVCALAYLGESKQSVVMITLRDEESGEPLDARHAIFVESQVFTHRESANRVHVYARREDAERHAEQYGGRIIASPYAALVE